eukprot:15459521-Alexandrium_andersonii.AAC.1
MAHRCPPWPAVAHRCPPWPAVARRGLPWPAVACRCTARACAAIRGGLARDPRPMCGATTICACACARAC